MIYINPEAVDQRQNLAFETIFVKPERIELEDNNGSPTADSCDVGCDSGCDTGCDAGCDTGGCYGGISL